MAYDPKSYLDQALKTGFQSVYSQPASAETGEAPQYQGDVARFGDVQVRPLSEGVYEGTGDAQYQTGSKQTGYVVSKPLTGQYEGYFLNHLYDNDGNFTGTSISEPDNDKYGLKSLAQMGLMAASFGALGPAVAAAANTYKGIQALKSGDILGAAASILPGAGYIPGVSKELADTLKTVGGYAKTGSALQKAIENKDILGALGAASDIPGVPKVPGEITDVLKGVGQANRIREAVRNEDPYAIFKEVVGASKTGVPFSKLADITGEDAIEGFFDPGGEGYYEGASGTSMDPMELNRFLEANVDGPVAREVLLQEYFPEIYGATDAQFGDWYQEGAIPVYSGVPEWDDALDAALQAGKVPSEEASQTVDVTGRRDDLNIDPWLQPSVDTERRVNVTEGEPQTIEVTGKREGTIIPDWDILPDVFTEVPDRTPGTVTPDDDRTVPTTPAPAPGPSPAPSPAPSPSPAPAPKPATPKSGMDLAALFALLGAMGGQGQDRQTPAQVNVATGTPESPFGLMYDLRG